MIVVDTNVIGYLYLTSEKSHLAEQALLNDREWAAPLLWRSEFRNVLVLYLRKRLLGLTQAQQIMVRASDLMSGREYEVPSDDVLRLASGSKCSAYDCEFVALANDLHVSLVTVDKKVLAEFPERAVSLRAFVS